jgi:hypothetical protein
MALTRFRSLLCVLTAVFVIPVPLSAFDAELSDTSVREAYFLGHHRDETTSRFLDQYTKHRAAPESGPYISSVTALTHYAQVDPSEGHAVVLNIDLESLR